MAKVVLVFKQVIDKENGFKKMVKLESVENIVSSEDLPDAYTQEGINIDYDEATQTLAIMNGTELVADFEIGEIVTPECMVEIQQLCERAGKRLDIILEELRDAQKNWEGRVVEYVVNAEEEVTGIIAQIKKFLGIDA
jgi:hypothetical protein